MIEVKNLSKRYGQNVALNNINFSVEKGTIVGFLGPNGAGKSTTMNIITGYLSASSGSVTVGGYNTLDNPNEVKKLIGYLPELPPLYPDMTVKEYLNFLFDLKKVTLPRKKHLEQICALTEITDVYDRLINNLSKGYKQRVGLAQALLGNPPVLILDEPTVGLDPKQIIEIRNLIHNLGKNHTIILSSHILPEIQAVCERIIIINRGKLVADGTPDSLSRSLSEDNRITVRMEGGEAEVSKALRGMKDIVSVQTLGEKEPGVFEYSVEACENCDPRRDLFRLAAKNNWPILEMKNAGLSLEDVFLRLTASAYIEDNTGKETEKEDEEA
ncbi:ABC transporter ATP-binding protein [Caproiciproducens galactitolivorans]|uniref:ATP-binding cassette domain-containing protein n=1 Tax=Caproiciproducens galactitolivorans TaxID=642589 RepID=A0ABT4BUV2_9FIRM|nr:ATP-binding cassette domain-containing protein [Caproiciproducens galactitolivorans]MCY1714672.1 ATP-binding cassette domain-containing protein [Caproiciproducens galactitolivorans]